MLITSKEVPLIEMKLGQPRLEGLSYNCNDFFICNLFCRICHRSTIELTRIGKDFCAELSKKPPKSTHFLRLQGMLKVARTVMFIELSLLFIWYLLDNDVLSLILALAIGIFISISLAYFWEEDSIDELLLKEDKK